MHPIPRLREKNTCPIALITTCGVSLEKSGRKKNETPSSAPGRVRERTAAAINSTNRAGMRILLIFSIPPEMPRETISTVAAINSRCRMICSHPFS